MPEKEYIYLQVATFEQLKQHKVVSMLQLDSIPGISEAEHNHVVYILSTAIPIVKKLIISLNYQHMQNVRTSECLMFR